MKMKRRLPWYARGGLVGTAVLCVAGACLLAPAAAQETNEAPAEAAAQKPSRPPLDPAVEPGLMQSSALMQEAKWEEAEALLRGMHAEFPEDPDVRRHLSLVLIQQEKMREALGMIEPLLGTPFADFVLVNNAAWIYATIPDRELRDSARALQLAQDALLLNPSNYHVWSTLAEAHYASGQFDKALKAVSEALSFARMAKANPADLFELQEQAVKIRKAAAAFSLIP